MRVHPLLSGEILIAPEFSVRRPGALGVVGGFIAQALRRHAVWCPVPVFLLEHPTAGPIMVDTGYSASAATDPARTLGPSARLFDHRPYDLGALLAARGVRAADVQTVVMTHLHCDHASGVDRFPHATFVADAREWLAGDAGGRGTSSGGYVPAVIHTLRRRRVLDFDGPRVRPVGPLNETIDLLGDGTILLVSTPGHSPGHMSVLVRLGSGGEVLLTGDAAHRLSQIERPAPMVPMSDGGAFLRSAQMLRAYARLHPRTVVIPGHDPVVWPTLDAVYA